MSLLVDATTWWQARDARERRMLLLMGIAIAAFAWWYGLVAPLRHARDAALISHQRAATALAVVESGIASLDTQSPDAPMTPRGDALAEAALSSARAAGVAIARQREGERGELVLDIDATDTAALLRWLDNMRQQHRLAPDGLSIAAESGMLRVQARFAAAQE
jgi:general secretion pathway protein M